MDHVDVSSALRGLGRHLTKDPARAAAWAGTGVGASTVYAAHAADERRNTGLTRVRKAALGPLTVDRFASEWYPMPPPDLSRDVPAAAARYAGR
jgi:hypothetical protein